MCSTASLVRPHSLIISHICLLSVLAAVCVVLHLHTRKQADVKLAPNRAILKPSVIRNSVLRMVATFSCHARRELCFSLTREYTRCAQRFARLPRERVIDTHCLLDSLRWSKVGVLVLVCLSSRQLQPVVTNCVLQWTPAPSPTPTLKRVQAERSGDRKDSPAGSKKNNSLSSGGSRLNLEQLQISSCSHLSPPTTARRHARAAG